MAKTYIPSDPLFGQQWHLLNTGQDIMGLPQAPGAYRNDINVTGVWSDYTGDGVVVAVVDNGFQAAHPDLAPNYLEDKAFDFRTNSWGQTIGDHGTSTMGLILAAQNDIGGVGVAYGAKGIGYSLANSVLAFNKAVTLMLMAGADVSSNSWGYQDDWTAGSFERSVAAQSVANLAQLGRDGLGTVTLFAAGNYRALGHDTNQSLNTNSPYVITVAAANVDGTVTDYSSPGASILVAAPGGGMAKTGSARDVTSIVTTDLLGTAGINRNEGGDYTNVIDDRSEAFTGTSAATPIAAGVVALMLEANPHLGYRDVQEILAYSASTPDGIATWEVNGASDWNGGGHRYNHDLGFGLIDALAAVRLAETWTKQGTFSNLVRETVIVTPDEETFSDTVVVKSGDTFETTFVAQTAIRVQHVTGSIRLELPEGTGELTGISATLTGPDGKATSVVLKPASHVDGHKLEFTFDTVHDWGRNQYVRGVDIHRDQCA